MFHQTFFILKIMSKKNFAPLCHRVSIFFLPQSQEDTKWHEEKNWLIVLVGGSMNR
jgi:hypothetical protein